MKPQWKDAPDWANWLAKDANEEWFWYGDKPYKGQHEWIKSDVRHVWVGKCHISYYAGSYRGWEFTLEQRPAQ